MFDTVFNGKWKIFEMEQWDPNFIDLIEPGFIEFMGNGFGALHFGYVYASIHYRMTEPGKAEFSFYGEDDGKEIFGRGWISIHHTQLKGGLFFANSPELQFKAEKRQLYPQGKSRNSGLFRRRRLHMVG